MSDKALNHRPRYVVVFYRAKKHARIFRFRTWDVAVEAADRFAERLEAAPVIFDKPTKFAVIHQPQPEAA